MYVCTYVCMCGRVYIYMNVKCISLRVYLCLYGCVFSCMYICMYASCTFTTHDILNLLRFIRTYGDLFRFNNILPWCVVALVRAGAHAHTPTHTNACTHTHTHTHTYTHNFLHTHTQTDMHSFNMRQYGTPEKADVTLHVSLVCNWFNRQFCTSFAEAFCPVFSERKVREKDRTRAQAWRR